MNTDLTSLPRSPALLFMAQVVTIQEIVDLIVDHLVHDILFSTQCSGMEYRRPYPVSLQLHELKQCALINKAFASRSQKHLFSTIELHAVPVTGFCVLPETEQTTQREPALEERSLQTINRLIDIFHQKPHLAMHLHTLRICLYFGYLLRRYNSLRQLMELLRGQGNPRNMVFLARESRVRPDHDFQESIGANIQSLHCWFAATVPAWFIANNPQLKMLNLRYCQSAQDEETYPCIPISSRATLKSLTLNNSWTVLETLLRDDDSGRSAVDFSYLRSLHLHPSCEGRDVSSVQQVISIAGPSLEVLTMSTYVHEPDSYSRPLDLSSCTSLQTTTLLMVGGLENNLDQLVDTLRTVPYQNSMKALTIEIYLPMDIIGQVWLQTCMSHRWDRMDSEIHRIFNTNVASLQPLIFNLRIWFSRRYMNTENENYEAAVKECEAFTEGLKTGCFPLTTSNRRIEFKTSTSFDVGYMY
ncbi:hypothetical protein BJ165DRAFT_1531182 [Panaeolus papilionaceus]|nr:hypothetical protein BJ165DRAFT_1531182 [Panaeolus papilionaceus]